MKRYIPYNLTKIYLFYFAFFSFFFVSAIILVIYSLGYKIDLSHWKFYKTGILRLQPIPNDCQIALDRKLLNPNKINKITEIPDLFPGNYLVEITCPQYQNWSKEIEIEPNQIFNESDILLIPKNIETKDLAIIKNYQVIPNQQLVYQNINLLYNLDFNSGKTYPYKNLELNRDVIIKNPNNNFIVINESMQDNFILLNTLNGNISNASIPNNQDSIEILGTKPLSPNLVLYFQNQSIHQIDTTQKNPPQVILDNISSPKLLNENLYFIAPSHPYSIITHNLLLGNTYTYTLQFHPIEILANSQQANYLIIRDDKDIFHLFDILQEKELYSFEGNYQISHLSPNSEYLLIQTRRELILINLQNSKLNKTLIRLSNNIDGSGWLNNANIIYSSGNSIFRIDINNNNHQTIFSQIGAQFDILASNNQKILVVSQKDNQYLLQYLLMNHDYVYSFFN